MSVPNPLLVPPQRTAIAGTSLCTNEWYVFFSRAVAYMQATGVDPSIIADMEARLAALEAAGAADFLLQGLLSVEVAGTPAGGLVQVSLVADEAVPGNTYSYGTGPTGAKGWFAAADAIAAGAGTSKSVAVTGVATIAHADTSSVGNLVSDNAGAVVVQDVTFTFDTFGHVLTATVGTVNLNGGQITHVNLGGLQGGSSGQYYHLTSGEYSAPQAALGAGSGFVTIAGTQTITGTKIFNGMVGVGATPDRPFVLSTASNPLPAGESSFLVFGDTNKERFEMRSAMADPTMQTKRSGGTIASPTATGTGTTLGNFGSSGHDGTNWVVQNKGIYRVRASENWTPTAQGAELVLMTTPNGSVANAFRWIVANNGHFLPNNDNTYDVGSGALRVREYFGAIGAINTSDAREKDDVVPFTEEEIAAAAELAREIGTYRWTASIDLKGDDARRHVGITVQRAIEVLRSHGLDPFRYGFICYDKWDARDEIWHEWPDVLDEAGVVVREAGRELVQEAREAGDRYSFRHDQLLLFIARGQAARLDALEAALSAA